MTIAVNVTEDRPVFHRDIGIWLAKLRADRGLSLRQIEIASKGSIRKGTLTSLEAGKIKHPDEALLRGIARIYRVEYREIANRFVAANYGRDLTGQTEDQKSGSSPREGDSPNDPTATRMELERLKEIVARYDKEAREMRTATDAIVKVALALEKTRKTSQRESDRRGRDRKVG